MVPTSRRWLVKTRALVLAVLALAALAPVARGDWNPGEPSKWMQYPNVQHTGVDVNATTGFIAADDFPCWEQGPITHIHLWGSWFHDIVGHPTFTLSIHADIPAEESPTGYSMPGEVLWTRTFGPGEYTARVWADTLHEGWMNPPAEYDPLGDSVCWQYNFPIPASQAFIQQGSPMEPVIYWLDVQASQDISAALFGWKTSRAPTRERWNDDAVWTQGQEPYVGLWNELRYPPGHPWEGWSIDLAFVIATEPTLPYDFGDAPDPTYPTLHASGGAYHTIVTGVHLGESIDGELDGQPDPNALGDDLAGFDDEDGIQFLTPIIPGTQAQVSVEASVDGFVSGWIDMNGDGNWTTPGDRVLWGAWMPAGVTVFACDIPRTATPGIQTFARFRFTTVWPGTLEPTGYAEDGEVEDYMVAIGHGPTSYKWIQDPDLRRTGVDVNASRFLTLADDFLCSEPGRLTEFRIWGSWLGDWMPWGDPNQVQFRLSIHADIPAWESPTGYSMPGELLWVREFQPGQFVPETWLGGIAEGFFDPNQSYYVFPADWTCWLYTFRIPPVEAFQQVGTPGQPIVYWLDVEAMPLDPDAWFGWKTSIEHWNDDAVWAPVLNPMWFELRYPPGHPMELQSIDLAFTVASDYGTAVPEGAQPEVVTPERFGLHQNIPNPFNPVTTIGYDVPAGGGRVTIEIFDVSGRLVRTLVDGSVGAGVRSAVWDGRDAEGAEVGSGVYFCRMTAPGLEQTVKMTLLK
jgi:hypothetical protein